MKTEIMILNVMNYEKEGQVNTRMGFIICAKGSISENDRFIGYGELSQYYKGIDVFEKIKKDMIGKPITANLKELSSPSNPMRSRQVIESIEYNGNLISLL